MTSKPTVYCGSCGAENPSARGACLLCYAVLQAPGGGLPCPACGHDNLEEGRFCASCGAPFAPGASRVPGLVESAVAVLQGGIASLGPDQDRGGEEEDFLGGLAEEPALPAFPAVASPAIVAPTPMPAAELDDDMLHMPPSALDLQEAAAMPPPAAPTFASQPLPEDDFAPPPPPAAPQPVAPAAPAAPILLDDDDMMPPPPPPGADDFAPAAAAPAAKAVAAPAPAAAAPAAVPAAPAPAAATSSGTLDAAGLIDPLAQAVAEAGSDEDFGDWSLEFPEDKKSE